MLSSSTRNTSLRRLAVHSKKSFDRSEEDLKRFFQTLHQSQDDFTAHEVAYRKADSDLLSVEAELAAAEESGGGAAPATRSKKKDDEVGLKKTDAERRKTEAETSRKESLAMREVCFFADGHLYEGAVVALVLETGGEVAPCAFPRAVDKGGKASWPQGHAAKECWTVPLEHLVGVFAARTSAGARRWARRLNLASGNVLILPVEALEAMEEVLNIDWGVEVRTKEDVAATLTPAKLADLPSDAEKWGQLVIRWLAGNSGPPLGLETQASLEMIGSAEPKNAPQMRAYAQFMETWASAGPPGPVAEGGAPSALETQMMALITGMHEAQCTLAEARTESLEAEKAQHEEKLASDKAMHGEKMAADKEKALKKTAEEERKKSGYKIPPFGKRRWGQLGGMWVMGERRGDFRRPSAVFVACQNTGGDPDEEAITRCVVEAMRRYAEDPERIAAYGSRQVYLSGGYELPEGLGKALTGGVHRFGTAMAAIWDVQDFAVGRGVRTWVGIIDTFRRTYLFVAAVTPDSELQWDTGARLNALLEFSARFVDGPLLDRLAASTFMDALVTEANTLGRKFWREIGEFVGDRLQADSARSNAVLEATFLGDAMENAETINGNSLVDYVRKWHGCESISELRSNRDWKAMCGVSAAVAAGKGEGGGKFGNGVERITARMTRENLAVPLNLSHPDLTKAEKAWRNSGLDSTVRPCFNFYVKGTCSRGGCRFEHSHSRKQPPDNVVELAYGHGPK